MTQREANHPELLPAVTRVGHQHRGSFELHPSAAGLAARQLAGLMIARSVASTDALCDTRAIELKPDATTVRVIWRGNDAI